MEMMKKSIEELHDLLTNGKITSEKLVKESLEKSHEVQEKYNAFVTILDEAKPQDITEELLSGIPYGVKDNFSTKDILTTGSSNTLRDYVPFFDATAVANLSKKGAIFTNKTVLDEFGMGATGTTGHTGAVKNPWDPTRMCAGSSAGSACAVACGVYPYALGSDTGDSVRKPAAFCGIVGFKPTYGMISRYGLFPYACSMDTVGVLARSVGDAAIAVDGMKGIDPKDMTSWDSSEIDLYRSIGAPVTGKKLCYVKELCDLESYPDAKDELKSHLANFKEVLETVRSIGIEVEEVSVDRKLLNAVASVYNVISYAEATSNLSNMTGIVFGPRNSADNYIDMIKNFRTENFSPLIKRRFVIGSYVLQAENKDRYFFNAQRVRRLLVDEWNRLFEKYDAVILPVSCGPAKKLVGEEEILDENMIALEEHLQIGNFGGFPSITIPDGFIDGLPVALNITGRCYDDANVLNIAHAIEDKLGFKGQIAEEVGHD